MNAATNEWERVKFGDVVRNRTDAVPNPSAQGLERTVGLDDLDRDSLTITRFGSTEDGMTFTRRFGPGQVLFGKRRAYQRKVAVADFTGVCSGDILVFEAQEERLTPKLLPFIVQSDQFFEHALRTSRGSLSPRTSWGDLVGYEFDLPPLAEQERIAELLWASEAAILEARRLVTSLKILRSTFIKQTPLESPALPDPTTKGGVTNSATRPLGDLLELCQYGLSLPGQASGEYAIVRMTNLSDGEVTLTDFQYVDLRRDVFDTYRLHRGDILFNRTNSPELVGQSGLFDGEMDCVFASYLLRLRVNRDLILPEFLTAYLNSDFGQQLLRTHMTRGVSQANINATSLKSIPVAVPTIAGQVATVKLLRATDKSIGKARANIEQGRNLKRLLTNQLLGRPAA